MSDILRDRAPKLQKGWFLKGVGPICAKGHIVLLSLAFVLKFRLGCLVFHDIARY